MSQKSLLIFIYEINNITFFLSRNLIFIIIIIININKCSFFELLINFFFSEWSHQVEYR